MNGVFLIDKPAGLTSFDVIARLRKILNEKRIGHTGTLDPNATGLLMILVGQSTKLVPFLSYQTKTYEATLKLGLKTKTGDIWGEVIETCPIPTLDESRITDVLKSFLGETKQVPPMVSALSVNGKRLYEYARENQVVDRQARTIQIHSLEGKRINDTIEFTVQCSSGTYVRTLCEDIAAQLGSCGTMSSLRRTRIDSLGIEDAVNLESFKIENVHWLNPVGLINYPEYVVEDKPLIIQGKALEIPFQGDRLKITYQSQLIAIYEWKVETQNYRSVRGLW